MLSRLVGQGLKDPLQQPQTHRNVVLQGLLLHINNQNLSNGDGSKGLPTWSSANRSKNIVVLHERVAILNAYGCVDGSMHHGMVW